MASDDELARTATAPTAGPTEPLPPLGETLGRYRLERPLGLGGMGVVHCAFDPDLERRVALKVLRKTDRGDEARTRLLREARALARLAHPNVVGVHEVGSVEGRDYVAMELVDGDTLDAWLKAQRRTPDEIVAAFMAAGRGLAAAHAAGLVHRDFKPHNVLRDHGGRIVVTDFGLARGVETGAPEIPSGDLPADLTVTGSLLGTPAYMAPEQWDKGPVGPAADQFSFCVALWEALTGERPFQGDDFDALKREIQRGAAALDVTRLPRRLRAPLRRGLDPDPARRWPDMNALLAALTRAERRPGVALAIGGGALVVAAVIYLIANGRSAGPACDRPVLDPASVWSRAQAAAFVRADQAPAAEAIDADLRAWTAARARACQAEVGAREPRLACLDGVLARIAVVEQAVAAVQGAPRVDAGELLIDPAVCDAPRPPRLMTGTSSELRRMMTRWLELGVSRQPFDSLAADALIERISEPCAGAVAHLLALSTRDTVVERDHDLDEAERLGQRCGDDRLIADIALAEVSAISSSTTGSLTTEETAKLKRAQALAESVMQPDLQADLDLLRASIARRADDIDEAIARTRAAADGYAARGRVRAQIRAGLAVLDLLESRGRPEDLADVPHALATWRDLAVRRLGAKDEVVRTIDTLAAWRQFEEGDVAGAHARLAQLRRAMPIQHARPVHGTVVDAAGAPVPGAIVTAGTRLIGDALAAAMPDDHARTTTTAADGTFTIPDAPDTGVVVAQLGDRRSLAAPVGDEVTLAIRPTTHIEGTVDLQGNPASTVTLVARAVAQPITTNYGVVAPVRPDGSFVLEGLPRGRVVIQTGRARANTSVIAGSEIDAAAPVVRGVHLAVGGGKRVLQVIVRSTVASPLANVQVVVLPGTVPSSNMLALVEQLRSGNVRAARQLEGEHAPASVLAQLEPGDMYATVRDVPDGAASACAIGLPDKVDEALARQLRDHMDRVEVRCAPVAPDQDVVVVEVPPFPRLD